MTNQTRLVKLYWQCPLISVVLFMVFAFWLYTRIPTPLQCLKTLLEMLLRKSFQYVITFLRMFSSNSIWDPFKETSSSEIVKRPHIKKSGQYIGCSNTGICRLTHSRFIKRAERNMRCHYPKFTCPAKDLRVFNKCTAVNFLEQARFPVFNVKIT